MIGRARRVHRNRVAGMVFDWRRGRGSTARLLFSGIVTAFFLGVLLAYVRVRGPVAPALKDDQIDLTLLDLDDERNQKVAAAIARETLFQQRWNVENPSVVAEEVNRIMAENSPRVYEPTLKEITRPDPVVVLSNLPGWEAEVLPEPDRVESVTLAAPPAHWWIEVTKVEGPDGLKPFAFPFDWPQDPGLMSEGDVWFVIATLDPGGTVVSIDCGSEKSEDPRTPIILREVQARGLTGLTGGEGIRIWRMQARLVNRSFSK